MASYTFGQVLLDQKQYKESERVLNSALGLGLKACDEFDVRIAICKLGQGLMDEAIQILFPIIENCSMDPDVYMLRAKLYFKQNNLIASINDLNTAIGLNPNHPEIACLKLSFMEYKVGLKNKAAEHTLKEEWDLAVSYLDEAIELDKLDWKLIFLRYQSIDKVVPY